MIAENAQPILDARLKGMRPADMVLVSMAGPVRTHNPLVLAREGLAYDWRWVVGLDVCLYIVDEMDWPTTLKDIALQRPAYLCLWNPAEKWGATVYLPPTAEDIDKPPRLWRYELDFLPWMDCQNDDFQACRRYERDEYGVPYAVDN